MSLSGFPFNLSLGPLFLSRNDYYKMARVWFIMAAAAGADYTDILYYIKN